MILLDTNICIYLINARPPEVIARFKQHRVGDIGVCSVVAAELAYGVAKSPPLGSMGTCARTLSERAPRWARQTR